MAAEAQSGQRVSGPLLRPMRTFSGEETIVIVVKVLVLLCSSCRRCSCSNSCCLPKVQRWRTSWKVESDGKESRGDGSGRTEPLVVVGEAASK